MKISAGGSVSVTAEMPRNYMVPSSGSAPVRRGDFARRFDSVSISAEGNRYGGIERELRGRLREEVRAAAPSGAVSSLREQIRRGDYRPDAAATARHMLLLEEAG